ncbi:hypothetical protein LTR16_004803 [Cryomyces antarcticus]|uniref:Uncharacterized protein n=1 Tax=Cryomyces antarcticus TaxID=329879 RepID=A0ABR0M7Q6_9PEZI|nr:hypothetical protein LTR16_004803 [Cryomyces antarcticus]
MEGLKRSLERNQQGSVRDRLLEGVQAPAPKERWAGVHQGNEGTAGLPVDTDIENPYGEAVTYDMTHRYKPTDGCGEDYVPKLDTLDNGSAVIVFEHSQSGSVEGHPDWRSTAD